MPAIREELKKLILILKMADIIPAINADNFEEIKEKIKLVEPCAKWLHLDVADGTFTKNTVWHNADDLRGLNTSLLIEVHLMINDVEKRVADWFLPDIKRIIFHLEAAKDADFIIAKCQEAGKEAGIAINPETSWTRLYPYFGKADMFQILGVHPGLAGQKFNEEVLRKIEEVRKNCRNCIIESDGGMNEETASKAVRAGANLIAAASAIFNDNIEKSFRKLKSAVNG
jgi:ribulose-phosphate 3-epimerase